MRCRPATAPCQFLCSNQPPVLIFSFSIGRKPVAEHDNRACERPRPATKKNNQPGGDDSPPFGRRTVANFLARVKILGNFQCCIYVTFKPRSWWPTDRRVLDGVRIVHRTGPSTIKRIRNNSGRHAVTMTANTDPFWDFVMSSGISPLRKNSRQAGPIWRGVPSNRIARLNFIRRITEYSTRTGPFLAGGCRVTLRDCFMASLSFGRARRSPGKLFSGSENPPAIWPSTGILGWGFAMSADIDSPAPSSRPRNFF